MIIETQTLVSTQSPDSARDRAPQSLADEESGATRRGALIVNADDWGLDRNTTDRIAECSAAGSLSSVSAMVFMEDSERAATLAGERGVDAGLHLNFTSRFSGRCPVGVLDGQQRLARFLLHHRFARVLYHPGLHECFMAVVAAQIEEFGNLYGTAPARIDGHHHMHLCANVLLGKLMPQGTLVRRNFSFQRGERNWANRFYRNTVDGMLARRHRMVDYLYALPLFDSPGRWQEICRLACDSVIELETHPANPEEHRFLTGGDFLRQLGNMPIAARFDCPQPALHTVS